jgi:signal transduction histidine kinase
MRTPITCIKGYTDLLAKGTAGPINDVQSEFLGTIRTNADRIASLVSDLTDIARIESGRLRLKPTSFSVSELIGEAVGGLQSHFDGKDQVLTVSVSQDLPRVRGDYARLTQVLTILLNNAHQYTPSGGRTTLVTEPVVDDGEGQMIHFAVHDNGIGIAPDEQALVFRKFYRSDDRYASEVPGSGLGLTIAKSLVEMHGGRIWLESTLGEGTTVHLALPVEPDPPPVELQDP